MRLISPSLGWFALLLCSALIASSQAAEPLRFTVMMHVVRDAAEDTELRAAFEAAQTGDPSFIVVNGMRAPGEPCTDRLFRQRAAMLESGTVPVILSLAGSDWIDCRDRQGRPASMAWLNLLREQVYGEISWSGARHLTLRRQSASRAFRSYTENTRWVIDNVLFATLNLPAENNHYMASAGGNSEFEDRATANREWIKRLGLQARMERRPLIVLFCDGNPLPAPARRSEQRDGFAEVRQQLRQLAEKSDARVLLIQGPEQRSPKVPREIVWDGRLGYVNLRAGVSGFTIDLAAPAPVMMSEEP
jgi:hypothetical protein